jgi:glutathione S-transferase
MKLYHTPTSPYARLVRMVVIEKGLSERVELIEAKTRTPGSPYYAINPSGRVPFLVRDDGVGMEDSQLIAAYLDRLDGRPTLSLPPEHRDWAYGRLEAYARSMVDGIAVHLREMRRPEGERSPTILAHEKARAERLADFWEREISDPLMHGALNIAQLLLVIALDAGRMAHLGRLEAGRAGLTEWAERLRQLPSVRDTSPVPR